MNALIPVRTKSTVHFIGAIAAAGFATEHLKTKGNDSANGVVPEGLAAGKTVRSRLKALTILSVEALPWEIQLFGSATNIGGAAAVIDTDRFLGRYLFSAAGTRATNDTVYYAAASDLDIPYEDFDRTSQIHIRLVNRHGATGKSAAGAGAVVVELWFEPETGRP